MGNSKLKFYIFLLLLASGCERTYYDTYIIKNSTNGNLTLTVFYRYEGKEIIMIPAGKPHTVIRKRGFEGEIPYLFKSLNVDSIYIDYDAKTVITQKCNTGNKFLNNCSFPDNLAAMSNYTKSVSRKKFGEPEFTYLFVIDRILKNN